jgi:hypothetical protein
LDGKLLLLTVCAMRRRADKPLGNGRTPTATVQKPITRVNKFGGKSDRVAHSTAKFVS